MYTVGWASGRAPSLKKFCDEVLVWLSVWSEVQIVCIQDKDISIHRPIRTGWSTLSVATLRCREGGATLLSTGSHESCVGCRQPEIRLTALWRWVSTSVLRLSGMKPRLMCRGCLHWHPMKYQRVSRPMQWTVSKKSLAFFVRCFVN